MSAASAIEQHSTVMPRLIILSAPSLAEWDIEVLWSCNNTPSLHLVITELPPAHYFCVFECIYISYLFSFEISIIQRKSVDGSMEKGNSGMSMANCSWVQQL